MSYLFCLEGWPVGRSLHHTRNETSMVLPQKNNPNTSHQYLPSELLQRPAIQASLFIFMWPGVRRLVVISSLGSTSLIWKSFWDSKNFPDSSASKESNCNARDPSSIPGLGRSTVERIGYPLQYSWASLEAQLVKDEKMVENKSLPWKIAPWYIYERTARPIWSIFFKTANSPSYFTLLF